MDKEVLQLIQWWKEAKYPIVFTGAGMSTEAGLPDFRSKTGLWKQKDPRKLASIDALHNNTEEFYEFYRQRLSVLGRANPHKGHKILAKFENKGFLKAIITQNVDGLHHKAGSKNVIELHGTLREAICIECKKIYPAGILEEIKIPTCSCGGLLKPGVILFGEMLPQDALIEAEQESYKSDLFIVIGSSLEVSPANLYPLQAKNSGAKLVFVNLEPTIMDRYADLVINSKAGEILVRVAEKLFKNS